MEEGGSFGQQLRHCPFSAGLKAAKKDFSSLDIVMRLYDSSKPKGM
jgi:hypothetical protein